MHSFQRTAGALAIVLALAGATARAAIVINEIDYDQPLSDAAEFIELYNTGPEAVDLNGYTVDLINGAIPAAYRIIPLTGLTLEAGEFLVICGVGANVPNCGLDLGGVTDLIQNGAPDAVVLRDDGSVVIDAVSYEGSIPGAVEGTGTSIYDSSVPFTSIARFPDGSDTDDNSADFTLQCSTPGWANPGSVDTCLDPLPTEATTWETVKAMYRD